MSDFGLRKELLMGSGVDDVPASRLVDQLEGDLVSEGPLENVVKLSFHDHKEQRLVTVLTDTITIQITVTP